MRKFFGRLLRWVVYLAAAGVMLLALLVGIARLLLPQVPEYQNEIRRWAGDATGFDVDFGYISASWPFAGPELKFLDVTLSSRDDRQRIFDAETLTVGISLVRLLIDREVMVNRVGIEKSRLEVQKDSDGAFFLQGHPIAELVEFQPPPGQEFVIPEVRIELDDIAIAYEDPARTEMSLDFLIRKLELRLSDSGVSLDGEVRLADEFGREADMSLDLPVALLHSAIPSAGGADAEGGDRVWSGYLAGKDLKVDRILEFWLGMEVPLRQAQGDVIVWAEFAGLMPENTTVQIDLEQIELAGPDGEVEAYEGVNGQLEWGRNEDGWVLGGSDLKIERNDQVWPESDFSVIYRKDRDTGRTRVSGGANFLRLHDLYPMVLAVASPDVRTTLLANDVSGDVLNLDVDINLGKDKLSSFDLEMEFEELGFTRSDDGESFSGMSGAVVADEDGGRLQINSEEADFAWPDLFSEPIKVDSIDGFLVWRVTAGQVRLLSDNIQIRAPFLTGDTRFELSVPRNGDSPEIDLTGSATVSDASKSLGYLPLKKFKPKLVDWLERSIVAGQVTGAQIEFSGALREFPYDQGEGVFRISADVEEGVLDYAEGWPPIENLAAQIVFDGVRFFVNRNRGTINGVSLGGADVRIDDLRTGLLEISARKSVAFDDMLALLRASPISDAIGPTLAKVQGRGELDTTVQLSLPTKQLKDYKLRVDAKTKDAELGLEGLDFGFSALTGSVRVENTKVYADGLTARLLDEPVTIKVRPAAEPGGPHTHYANVTGDTPATRWMEALSLPFPERFEGRAAWNAMALIPARKEESGAPLHILVRSDLAGVTSTLPAPLDKTADRRESLELDIAFPQEQVLEVFGRLDKDISWAIRLESLGDQWRIIRGAVHAGSASALIPSEPGVELSGHLEELRFDDWLAMTDDGRKSRWLDLYREADFKIDQLFMFGKAFPDVDVGARRVATGWQVNLDGPNMVGTVGVPMAPSVNTPIRVEMERLWLIEDDPVESVSGDPRTIEPARVRADDFRLGDMRFGSLSVDLTPASAGIIIDPIRTEAGHFRIDGDAAWLVHPNDESIQQSQLRLKLQSGDIKATLTSLGYEPVIEGEVARASVDLTWAGSLGGEFLHRADGQLNVLMEQGALLELEPGGGRLLGVLSVAALPRRLSLDFSDVFDEGLGFDTLQGDFVLNAGNAYTCNLGLEGSVADLGIVGRAGIAAEDYDQVAVVRPHVSSVLAIGGTVVGGPAVGAAMLLFSEIFKKPLSTLGESYYRVEGPWEAPDVTRITGPELEAVPLPNCDQILTAENPRLPTE